MLIKKMLYIFLAGCIFSAPCAQADNTLSIEVATQTELVDYDSTMAQQRLETVIIEHDLLIRSYVIESFLSTQQLNSYQLMLCSWDSKIEQISQELACGKNVTHHLLVLELFIECTKKIHLKLQLLTVGIQDSPKAIVQESIHTRRYQQILVDTYLHLSHWFMHMWTLQTHELQIVDNPELALLLLAKLPSTIRPIEESLFFDASKDSPSIFLIDLLQDSPRLAEGFITTVLQHEANGLIKNDNIMQKALSTINKLLTLFEEKSIEYNDNEDSYTSRALDLLAIKLLKIKRDITLTLQLEAVKQNHPTMLDTFTKHYQLINDAAFDAVYAKLPYAEQCVIDEYTTLAQHFFTTNEQSSELFTHNIKTLIADYKQIKARYDGGKLKQWTWGTGPLSQRLGKMLDVLSSIQASLEAEQEEKKHQQSGIISAILSGEWLTNGAIKKISQSSTGDYILEFAQDFLGTRTFNDAKSAAGYILAYASPFLLPKILSYLNPGLKNGDNSAHDKIIEFANKNPDLLKELNEKHPEILNLLATSLKDLAQKGV